jgi:hypothetical protein
MTSNPEEQMNKDLKSLNKDQLAKIKGGASKTLRQPVTEKPARGISAALCGGSSSCVAVIDVE